MKLIRPHALMSTACNSRGFTLIEVMIGIAISGIVAATIYAAYTSQQRTAIAQEQAVEMQQNIRAGLEIMSHDIRMAGYNPNGSGVPTPAITLANATQLQFTRIVADPNDGFDNDNDGAIDEGDQVELFGYDVADTIPLNDGFTALRRTHQVPYMPGNPLLVQAVADNIDAIEFFYTMADGTQTTTPAILGNIRTVQISILARASRPDPNFVNNIKYTPASGNAAWVIHDAAAGPGSPPVGVGNPPNDNFRRRLLISTIQFRNMGL
jgi:type IV pilus assembly protein PilW